MSVGTSFEALNGRVIKRELYEPGNAFCHLDEKTGRLMLAHPMGVWDGNVLVYAQDEYGTDIDGLSPDEAKALCSPKTLIDEIEPWGRRFFAVHEEGVNVLLTIKNLPLVRISPVREIEI